MTSSASRFRRAKDSVRSGPLQQLGQQWDSFKYMSPVYRVQIRYPDKNGKPKKLVLADTSMLELFPGMRSAVIGMWVDKTCLASNPDKCQVIVHNEIEGTVIEKWLHDRTGMGAKNWLDIWMGYKIPGMVTMWTVMPEPFTTLLGKPAYGNKSHIFSGPLVRVDREVSVTAGDRLRLTGWDAVHMLQSTLMNSKWWLRQETFQKRDQTIGEHLDKLLAKGSGIKPFPSSIKDIAEGGWGFVAGAPAPVYMGNFHYNLFDDDWRSAVTDSFVKKGGEWDAGKLKGKLENTKFDWSANLPGKYDTLWSYIKALLDERRHGLGMLDARMVPNSNGQMQLQIFRTLELDDLIDKWNSKKAPIPRASLGMNMVDINCGVEAGNIWNCYDYITPGPKMRAGDPNLRHNFPLGPYPFELIPEEHRDSIFSFAKTAKKLDKKKAPFVQALLEDIYIYGPNRMPETIWFPQKEVPVEGQTEPVLDGEDMVDMIRRFYFGGLQGECLVIGDPIFRPGIPVLLTDDRRAASSYGKTALAMAAGVAGAAAGAAAKAAKAAARIAVKTVLKKGIFPITEVLKLDDFHDRYFFLWKVRHYIGVGAGYTTKLYWCQERHSEELALPSQDIQAQLRQAFAFGEMQRRGGHT